MSCLSSVSRQQELARVAGGPVDPIEIALVAAEVGPEANHVAVRGLTIEARTAGIIR